MNKHVIVYSHGFGVQKDARGMFTDIAAAFPDAEHIMFDYNQIDGNEVTVLPLTDQVAKLDQVLQGLPSDYVIDLVCHSNGCLVAALSNPDNIRRCLFLAPPDSDDVSGLLETFSNRLDVQIDLDGISRIPRRDGTTTIVPAAYWQSKAGLEVIKLYNELSTKTKLIILEATADEVMGMANFDTVSENVQLDSMYSDHDFTGDFRAMLVDYVKRELSK